MNIEKDELSSSTKRIVIGEYIIAFILGFFVFGGISGGLATTGFALILNLFLVITVFPYGIGLVFWLLITLLWFNPTWFSLTGMCYNWLTIIIYIIALIMGSIINVGISISRDFLIK